MRRPHLLPLFALLAGAAWGADFAALRPEGYVNDFAQVLDAGAKASLESYCARVESATQVQIALVTLPSLEGEPVEDVANLLYRKWGVGNKKNNEGVLVLLAIRDRRSRIEVGYGLEPLLPDGYAGQLLREMRPALKAGDYGEALREAAEAIGGKAAQAKGVSIGARPTARRSQPHREGFPIGLIFGGIVVLLLLSRLGGGGGMGGLLTGMMIGNMMGGGRGSGGFGGYDSGGGFGGFGGGDSGGGGASGDW
jgi:uncharacterized protein